MTKWQNAFSSSPTTAKIHKTIFKISLYIALPIRPESYNLGRGLHGPHYYAFNFSLIDMGVEKKIV